ncbi:MAG TPA: hypothetical protein VET23_02525 [Chitinophagaceae bacterium]|nr:hypothetical protein [Chitinophagaceae bacterium]
MKNRSTWINIAFFNLCMVAVLGFILRSKILFELPWINYLNLLDAHYHFAFEGWVTFALLLLMVSELLPESLNRRPVYTWLFAGIVLCSFSILIITLFNNNTVSREFFSYLFILFTYVIGWRFLKDLRKIPMNKTVRLLSVSAIVCLILSSVGPVTLTYLHATRSMHPFFYRDASYVYLHLQYNGFFTLAVFALLFQKLYPLISKKTQQNFYGFAVLLCVTVLPSLFLSFLWQDPNSIYRIIAVIGSILIFLSVTWFVIAAFPLLKLTRMASPAVRYILMLSTGAFVLKTFLQSFTIFPSVGNAVFGDRPVIIGFLHLVFLGFVSPFILAWYVRNNGLNIKNKLTVFALILFILGIAFNEITLMLQGLGAMFLESSYLFPWILWIISIWLMTGAILIFAARLKSRNTLQGLKKD